jgi:regulatory protein
MTVRFSSENSPSSQKYDSGDSHIAEIIELRGKLSDASKRTPDRVRDEQGTEAATEGRSSSENDAVLAPVDALPSAKHEITEGAEQRGDDEAVSDLDAYQEGVRILARKQLSEEELRRALGDQGHDRNTVDAVVFEFVDRLYLDDETLARAVMESLREKKRASRAEIARQLYQRMVSRVAIETVLAEIDSESEFELLDSTAQDRARKLVGLDRQTAERRLLGFLARRGWQGEPAMRAAREALDAACVGARGGSGGRSAVRFE